MIASRLEHSKHVAVGASSPIPAAASLFAQHINPDLQVSLLGNEEHSSFTDGGRELFDCAAQGRIDTFFLSGVQIDGKANINLVGTGSYPALDRRFAGSFGSAYLYHIVPRVILFCWNHKPSVLVDQVDFISANGPDESTLDRTGGPDILLTNRCSFDFDREGRQFRLTHLHPEETIQSIAENTGFDYLEDRPCRNSPVPDEQTLHYMRTELSSQMKSVYPRFSEKLWNN